VFLFGGVVEGLLDLVQVVADLDDENICVYCWLLILDI